MCYDRRVDDQQHPRHCKKKCTSYVTLALPPRWRENQAFGYHLLLEEIIMVLMRRIEDEEAASGCCIVVVERRELLGGDIVEI